MRDYLPAHGSMALDMMHVTASVQVSFDFSDEEDMISKMRTALGCGPIVSRDLREFEPRRRADPPVTSRKRMVDLEEHRSRPMWPAFPSPSSPGIGYARYAEWAIDVPMFFILRGERYLPMRGKTFRRFLQEGHEGERASLADWNRHLTTVFPDVRMKRVIEVRGADSCPADLACSVPALWKGLLYDQEVRAAAHRAGGGLESGGARRGLPDSVARRGLGAEAGGRKVVDLARELLDLAREGLSRESEAASRARKTSQGDERSLLEPVAAQLALGRSPGQVLLDEWEGALGRSPDRLIRYARY